MNFDPTTFASFELPKHLHALLKRDDEMPSEGLPRRSFLKLTALSGFALGAFPLGTLAQDAAKPAGLKPTDQPSAFVQIDKDGITTITINRLDFGQGVQTSLPMILAEELDADWSKVRSVHGSNAPGVRRPGVRHAHHRRLRLDRPLVHAVPRARRTHPRDADQRGSGAVEDRRVGPAHAERRGHRPRRQAAQLRRTRRCRDEAAGAGEGRAEGPEGLPPDRQGRPAGSTRRPSPAVIRATASTPACPAC